MLSKHPRNEALIRLRLIAPAEGECLGRSAMVLVVLSLLVGTSQWSMSVWAFSIETVQSAYLFIWFFKSISRCKSAFHVHVNSTYRAFVVFSLPLFRIACIAERLVSCPSCFVYSL